MAEASTQALLLAVAMLCSAVGMAWLALAMDVHWTQVHGAQSLSTTARRLLRILGGVALATSLALCWRADTPGMAVLVWVMELAAGALLVAFALAWWPRGLKPLTGWTGSCVER